MNLLRPVTFASGGGATYYVSVKHPDGTIDTRTCVYPGSATPVSTITLNSALSQNPSAYTGNQAQDAIFLFDPQATPGKKLKIVAIEPSGDKRVKITCTDEYAAYYTSESGSFNYTALPSNTSRTATVSNLTKSEQIINQQGRIEVVLQWTLGGDATGVNLRLKHQPYDGSTTNVVTQDVGYVAGQLYRFIVDSPETLTVEIQPIGNSSKNTAAAYTSQTFIIQGIYDPDHVLPTIPNVTGLQLVRWW